MFEVFAVALASIGLLLQAEAPAPGGDWTGWDWGQLGVTGLCLAAVGVFARQAVDRERKKADERETYFVAELARRDVRHVEELRIERERHDRENSRIIAQRDGLIKQLMQDAIPALAHTSEVLGNRQKLDEAQIQQSREVAALLVDVRRALEARR